MSEKYTREDFLRDYAEAGRLRRDAGVEVVRPVLVGEDNPYSKEPTNALLPFPSKSAGARLQRDILGLSVVPYLANYDRVNLCGQRWGILKAREEANRLRRYGEKSGTVLVLLGSKVCQAFRVDYQPHWAGRLFLGTVGVVILPHPSGRSREWNEPGAVEKARTAMREAGCL